MMLFSHGYYFACSVGNFLKKQNIILLYAF